MSGKDHKLAAIVFTDIVGYTKQMEENEQRTMQLLEQQREIIFPLVKAYGGEVIKEIGDGLMMMFGSAVEAVRFAIAVQKRLHEEELTIRAGIHIGDVIFRDGDVFGSAVNTAARIEPLAPPNGICISEDVRSQLQNKSDIFTIPIGKKELKGVKFPVTIYEVFIEGVTLRKKQSLKQFVKDLWDRAVIQIMLGYLVSAWIIKLAVASIVGELMLSPYLVDLTWVILLTLLPTVFLLTYFHSRRKEHGWNRIELVGLPVNLVLTLLLSIFLFGGKDLGATTTELTVQNEEGEEITRTVLKSEFRKKLAIFFFDNLTDDKSYDWLQYGLASLLEYDLRQNRMIEGISAFTFIDKFANNEYPDGLDVPLSLQKKIAGYYHKNYFTTGSFDRKGNTWQVNMGVYETHNGKLLERLNIENENLFNLVDEVNVELKKALNVSEAQIEQSTDLPVAEIFTREFAAFKAYTLALTEIYLHNNWEEGVKYAEKAIDEDSDFAMAHLTLAEYYFNNNQPAKAEQSLTIARAKDYKLSERKLFYLKFFYYLIQQKPEQANAVIKMWAELYPDDIEARAMLAQRHVMQNNLPAAINQIKQILAMSPQEYDYIQKLGDIYELAGKYDSSIYYYSMYAEKFPKDFISHTNLGDSYRLKSDFEKSKENYNKALLLEPDNTAIVHKIVDINLREGKFSEALETLQFALPRCKTPTDSVRIYDGFQNYHQLRGEIELAFQYFQTRYQLLEKILPPLRIMVFKTFSIDIYNEAGKDEEAMNLLQEIETQFQPPFDKVSAFGYLFYYIETGKPDKAETYISEAVELIEGFGEQTLLSNIHYARGRIAELKNEFPQAIEYYQQFLEQQPGNNEVYRWLSRCYRESGDMKTAKEYLDKAITRHPSHPKNYYEAALYWQKNGNNEKALDNIRKATAIWQNADAVYQPATEAQRLKQQLEGLISLSGRH